MVYETRWIITIVDKDLNKREEIVYAKNSVEAVKKFIHKHSGSLLNLGEFKISKL